MIKSGIKFDYDLKANEEIKEGKKCLVCELPLHCRWTDYSGEGVCMTCGTSYQLKWGGKEKEKENKYPYLNIKSEYLHILKEYWNKTKMFVFHGTSFSEDTGKKEFNGWLKENHPELFKSK